MNIEIKGTRKKKKYYYYFLIDILINAFIVTPAAAFYWAATWDICESYLFADKFYLQTAILCLIANFIILINYLFQENLQNYHDKLRNSNSKKYFHYGKDFIFRSIISYIISIGYVCQWVAYWNLYDRFTQPAPYYYFTIIAFIALFAHRYILKYSLFNYACTVPFYFIPDAYLDTFFLMPNSFKFNNVRFYNSNTK